MSEAHGNADAHDTWLRCLRLLLNDLSPGELCLLRMPLAQDLLWYERAPDPALIFAVSGTGPASGRGWLVRLDDSPTRPTALFVGNHGSEGVDRAQLMLGAVLCRTAWRFADWRASGGEARRDDNAEAIHALRNALNAVVMNAAVLAQYSLPDRAQAIAQELQAALARSLEALNRFALLVH